MCASHAEPSSGRSRFVQVAVNAGRPTSMLFTYGVPAGREVRTGELVHVPWGQRTLQGIVTEGPLDIPGYLGEIRDIEPALKDAPVMSAERLAMAAWLSEYYLAPPWEAHAVLLPPGAGERPRTEVVRGSGEPGTLSERQRQLYELLSDEPKGLEELRAAAGARGFDSVLRALLRRQLAERRYSLARPRGRARVVEELRLAVEPEQARAAAAAITGRRASRRARALRALLDAAAPLPFDELAKLARGAPAVETLLDAGVLARDGEDVRLALPEHEVEQRIRILRRSRAQVAAAALLELLADAPEVGLRVRELAGVVGAGARDAVRWLVEQQLARLDELLDRRDPLRNLTVVTRSPLELIGEQRQAAATLRAAIDRADGSTFLLHGVTGSGKTEVYLDALTHAVEAGRRAIVLVPEIALTPQTVRRFAERFPGRVGVLHSGLTLGEAYDEWHAIENGDYDVVIGSRSAIFAPQPALALIVIDEAHEWTYKQQDTALRYDARTVAEWLAARSGAALVFGTATPDAARWYAAEQGEIGRLELPRRVRAVRQPDGTMRVWPDEHLPEVEIVDVRGARRLFSDTLIEALAETLDRDEQAILFLNRRGLAGLLLCSQGHSPTCRSCDVSLSLHDPPGRLVCHLCNRTQAVPRACEECASPLRQSRAGTQAVEREVRRLFPAVRVVRWDSDTARTADQHAELLGQLTRHEVDVLVGTQMIAKGLDLPLVTLVGVVLADYSLWTPDPTARERTVQLLVQVAGRAGRADRDGRVVIQTMQPDEPAIRAVADHDLDSFFEQELRWRASHGYPPFRRAARLLFSHANAEYAAEEAGRLARELERLAVGRDDVEVRGPTRPMIARLRGRHRWALTIMADDPTSLLRDVELAAGWAVDIDPVTFA